MKSRILLLLFVSIMLSGAANAATIIFFDSSQTATLVASGVTSDTISSTGYLFTYTRDKLFGGGTGRPVRVPWPEGVEAQAVTVAPVGKAQITISRVDGNVFDIPAFTAKLLASTAGAGGAFEVMPQLNGEDGYDDPIFFSASGPANSTFSYDTETTPQSTSLLTGFDTYKIKLYVDFALTGITLVDALVDAGAEIIGTWDNGIRYWDVAASNWTQMTADVTTGDIAAGDFTGDGKADVASSWEVYGLWYQDGATLAWTQIDSSSPSRVTAGDVTGDGRDEIIGTWDNGIWYWDVAASNWTQMTADVTTGDIAAGDFTGDGKADVASSWEVYGLWYQDGATLAWTQIDSSPPSRVTAGDVTGDGRDEIIGTWDNGIWYWDVAASTWTQMTPFNTTGDIAAEDFTGDGKADVASSWDDGLWYQDGATLAWTRIDPLPAYSLTAGDVTGP